MFPKTVLSLAAGIIAAAAFVPRVARAEDALSVEGSNHYLAPKGVVVHHEPVIQTDLRLDVVGPCYADFWWSVSPGHYDANDDFGDEIDYTFGCVLPAGPLTVHVGVSYFDMYPLFDTSFGALSGFGETAASFDLFRRVALQTYVRGEYHDPLEWGDIAVVDGFHLLFGLRSHSKHDFGSFALGFRGGVALFHDTGTYPEALGTGDLLHFREAIDLEFGRFTLTPFKMFMTSPLSDFHGARTHQKEFGAGMAYVF